MNLTLFTPYSGQLNVINGFADSQHKFGVVATGRQYGKSLLAQNLMLYWLLSNQGQKGCWIAPVYNQCRKVFQELTNAAHQIISKSNKAELTVEFINGSTLIFLSSERPDSIRGFSFNYVVIDEASFVSEQAVNEAILPTLSALGKKCLIISTPKGKNWFYSYFIRGLNDNHDIISFQGKST
jgi:phage terminase large subunit-like protein